MFHLVKVASLVSRLLAILGAVAVLVMMCHICLDVMMRNLFNISFDVTHAMVARYYMVPLAFLPLGWIELRDEMVSVELIDAALPTAVLRATDVIVALVAAAIYGVLTWATWDSAMSNLTRGTFLLLGETRFYTWPSYWVPMAGFALAGTACLIRAMDRAFDVTPGKASA